MADRREYFRLRRLAQKDARITASTASADRYRMPPHLTYAACLKRTDSAAAALGLRHQGIGEYVATLTDDQVYTLWTLGTLTPEPGHMARVGVRPFAKWSESSPYGPQHDTSRCMRQSLVSSLEQWDFTKPGECRHEQS